MPDSYDFLLRMNILKPQVEITLVDSQKLVGKWQESNAELSRLNLSGLETPVGILEEAMVVNKDIYKISFKLD